MLRGLCSESSIFPVVYLIKATTTTRKMEDPELQPFRMTLFYLTAKAVHQTSHPRRSLSGMTVLDNYQGLSLLRRYAIRRLHSGHWSVYKK